MFDICKSNAANNIICSYHSQGILLPFTLYQSRTMWIVHNSISFRVNSIRSDESVANKTYTEYINNIFNEIFSSMHRFVRAKVCCDNTEEIFSRLPKYFNFRFTFAYSITIIHLKFYSNSISIASGFISWSHYYYVKHFNKLTSTSI